MAEGNDDPSLTPTTATIRQRRGRGEDVCTSIAQRLVVCPDYAVPIGPIQAVLGARSRRIDLGDGADRDLVSHTHGVDA